MTTKEEKAKTWQNILMFIGFEWFGEEFIKGFLSYDNNLIDDPVQEGETAIDSPLEDHEKIFWNFVDSLFDYLRKNRKKLPAGDLEEKRSMADGLKAQFWGMLKMNHPEFMDAENIGIRRGYVIVNRWPVKQHPLVEIIKGGSFG